MLSSNDDLLVSETVAAEISLGRESLLEKKEKKVTSWFGNRVTSERNIIVVHDFDLPLYTRRTSLKRSIWLFLHSVFGDRMIKYMPVWLRNEKYNLATALSFVDRHFDAQSIFAITERTEKAFPSLRQTLLESGSSVAPHWHVKEKRKGYSNVYARGAWRDSDVDYRRTYMNYDREYMKGTTVLPDPDTFVIWHVDHMPLNLSAYLEFLERMKNENE